MKTISITVCALCLSASAFGVQAANANELELEQCKEQVSQYYGGATDMRYVSKRQFRDGTQVQLAVHSKDPVTGYSQSRLANCWLGAENFQAYNDGVDEAMVAEAVAPTSPVSEEILP